MEFNESAFTLLNGLRTVDSASLGDAGRCKWFITPIDELGNVPFSSDWVELDFDRDDFLTVLKHPRAFLRAEVVTPQDVDNRNARGNVGLASLMSPTLLGASSLSLNAADRPAPRRQRGG